MKVWIVLLALSGIAGAQDTRNVSEPSMPGICAVLKAPLITTLDENGGKVRSEDEGRLATQTIQDAMDRCTPGMGVELAGGTGGANAFLTGPLELRAGVTLVIDRGVTLYGSRDPAVYELHLPGSKAGDPLKCGTSLPRPGTFGQQGGIAEAAALRRGGCRPLISATNVSKAAVMGAGTIDGRGYAKLIGHDYSWWEMARRAEPRDDIYFSVRLIVANRADGLILSGITLHNSPNFHVSVNGTDGLTVWGVHLLTPVDKKLDARNTDGIDPGSSSNVTIAHSWIDNGDDNIAIKANVQHISVLDSHFYTGHGMSIGSEATGDAYLLVDGLTEDHTTSGIRIKSNVTRGGYDHDLTYRHVCMRDVANPIAISPYYTNQTTEGFVDPKYTGTKIPDYKKIVLEDVVSETPGNVLIAGIDDAHRTEIALHNVVIEGIQTSQVHLAFADITQSGATSGGFDLSGGTSVKLLAGDGATSFKVGKDRNGRFMPGWADPCTNKFLPMR